MFLNIVVVDVVGRGNVPDNVRGDLCGILVRGLLHVQLPVHRHWIQASHL